MIVGIVNLKRGLLKGDIDEINKIHMKVSEGWENQFEQMKKIGHYVWSFEISF